MEVRANLRRYSRDVRSLRRQWRERESGKQRLLHAILRSSSELYPFAVELL